MATLRDIKTRINAISSNAKITQAMRMVSAAKLRRAQEAILSARPYVKKFELLLSNLVESVGDNYDHPFIQKRKEVKSIVLIAIAGDRGLCGSFNNNLFKLVNKYISTDLKDEHPDANVSIISVGKRSVQAMKIIPNVEIMAEFPGVFQSLKFDTAKSIINIITEAFNSGKVDKVVVLFNEFKNLLIQIPSTIQLLPIVPKKIEIKDTAAEPKKYNIDYIYEPDQESILNDLLPKNLDIQLWRTLLESNAAENAARMMAMENATNNANDLVKYLQLIYNKERQAAITTEMLEIVGGANALQKA